MSWPRHTRRHTIDCTRFIRALLTEFSARELARCCGVSDRTVRRWAAGTDWPARVSLDRLVESICPRAGGSLPLYSPDMAIDGDTRVGGVGDYTRRAAQGLPCYEEDYACC